MADDPELVVRERSAAREEPVVDAGELLRDHGREPAAPSQQDPGHSVEACDRQAEETFAWERRLEQLEEWHSLEELEARPREELTPLAARAEDDVAGERDAALDPGLGEQEHTTGREQSRTVGEDLAQRAVVEDVIDDVEEGHDLEGRVLGRQNRVSRQVQTEESVVGILLAQGVERRAREIDAGERGDGRGVPIADVESRSATQVEDSRVARLEVEPREKRIEGFQAPPVDDCVVGWTESPMTDFGESRRMAHALGPVG